MQSILFILLLSALSFCSFAEDLSYSLIDLESGKTITEENSKLPVTPASIAKLYTTYYVLSQKDSNHSFKTKVAIKGRIEKGVLNGDLIILPDGDPYLTVQNLIELIHQIQNQGIYKITGQFIIHPKDFWFTERLSSIGLEDQADNSSMGIFNVEFNRFNIDGPSHKPIPSMDYLKIKKSKDNSYGLKFGLEAKNEKYETWLKYLKEQHSWREEVPTRHSLYFSAHYFRYLAKLHGLELPTPIIEKANYKTIIATHSSLPLYRLVQLCLEFSNNLMAEMLLLTTNNTSNLKAATDMLDWYKKKFPKLDWENINFVNGSGLDLKNTITANNLTSLLAQIHHQEFDGRSFWSFLSINGHSGGIRKRLTETEYAFKVHAKTGSVFFVNNLAGYLKAQSGKWYAFSIFTTHEKNRGILNQHNSKQVDQIRKKNKSWYQMSTNKIDQMIISWIKKY